jgi:competence protein ComEA
VVLYTRHQLALLFSLLAAAGVGLAVREWRAAYPAAAERLERFDRAPEGQAPGPRTFGTPLGAQRPLQPRPTQPGRAREAALQREVAAHGPRIDLNAATAEDLTRLPGVGPALAARILETRQRRGRFGALDDLRLVKGLGGAGLDRLRPRVTIGP